MSKNLLLKILIQSSSTTFKSSKELENSGSFIDLIQSLLMIFYYHIDDSQLSFFTDKLINSL